MFQKQLTGGCKVRECHLFVETCQSGFVGGLKSDGDFQLSSTQLLKPVALVGTQSRVIFDDDCVEVLNALSDCREVPVRNGSRVEEVAAVIKFDMGGRGQLSQSEIDLSGDQAGGQ
ncbi:MAG: hypothetical protein RIT02_3614 [Planctomycetota bacterium]|jgi:hypothetical protein